MIARRIREYLVRRCFVNDPIVIDSIKTDYARFFRGLTARFGLALCDPGGESGTPSVDIFTTNYDNVVEEYARTIGVQICDGYEEIRRGNFRFDHAKFERSPDSLRLYKIHGTVTYARLANGLIDRVTYVPPRGPLVMAGQVAFPELIYPGSKPYLSAEPQLELLFLFKRALSNADVLLIIGHSLRDPNINEVLRQVSATNSKIRLFLVSPHAGSVIKSQLSAYGTRAIAIDKTFRSFEPSSDLT